MQYIVLGATPTACVMAAYLAKHDVDVMLVDSRSELLDEIANKGISLTGFRGDFHTAVSVQVLDGLRTLLPASCVLVCDHPATVQAKLETLLPLSAQDTVFVTFASSLVSLKLVDFIGPDRLLAGVANFEARIRDDRSIETDFHNFIWLGEIDGTHSDRLNHIQNALSWVAPTFLTSVIRGMIWSKAIYSIEAALAAVVDASPIHVYDNPRHRRLAATLVRENIALADALGATPIAFDFFDPNLYRADNPGEGEVTDVWIKNAWMRHEQFRVGVDDEFPPQVGLGWQLSPANPNQEATKLFDELLEYAQACGLTLPLTRELSRLHGQIVSGHKELSWDHLAYLESARKDMGIDIPYPQLG